MTNIIVRKRQRWSAVPDVVLENRSLSFSARLALAWMLGREEGWEIKVGYMCRVLGLTDKTWPRVRDELVEAGFYSQEKRIMPGTGKIFWICEVTDAPLYQSESIPPKKGDGQKTIPPFGMDGASMDGNGGDYHTVVNQPVVTKTTTPPSVDNSGQEKRSSSCFSLFLKEAGNPQALTEIAPQLEVALAQASEQQARWAGAAWRHKVSTGKIGDSLAYAFILCQKAAAGLVVKPGKLVEENKAKKTQDLISASLELTQLKMVQQEGHGLAGKTVVFSDGARLKLGKAGAKIGGVIKPLSLIQKMIDAGEARIDEEAIAA